MSEEHPVYVNVEGYDCEFIATKDAVPKEALRELVEEWRERGVEDPYGHMWHWPADELEVLIDE